MKLNFNYLLYLVSAILVSIGCSSEMASTQLSPYELVNTFIGTGGHGHTYPGATLPFGMVQLSPDTRLDGWDGCSGYHYSDSIIYGFSHTHLSGTGVSDYGDILLMPFNHKELITYQNLLKHEIVPSEFSKTSEKAKPGYYSVELEDAMVELTATEHVGIHHYQFKTPEDNKILLDLKHRDKVLDFNISIKDQLITGHRISEAWATEQHVYFAIAFSDSITWQNAVHFGEGPDYFKIISFNESTDVMVKVGISFTSIDGAINNLRTEAPHWDFEKYKDDARQKWGKALSKIEAKDKNKDKLSIFYSALYHTMIVPNAISDVDGQYRGMDQKVHHSKRKQYSIFSLWDTFRATHPLYTIIEGGKNEAFIHSFLNMYEQGGRLPVWELAANETDCMIGYHSIPVIVDAYVKGYQNFDKSLALKAMLHSAELNHFGLDAYKAKGYIAAGDEAESVSKTLEYAYDDWCIAQFAKSIGNDSIYHKYIKRSQYYKNLFNPETQFFQAKMNGNFVSGFDPAEVNFNFTEANAWQYSLFVPHDIQGLIDIHGGSDAFENHIDELFSSEMVLSGRHQADITGLIGQYAHGNEPSHHMAYLYNYIGKPHKTQYLIHQILTQQYHNMPDGLSGNEDCGQMSAWYVLSAMGFYSVTPGSNYYTIGTPHLESATIHLENGESFSIQTNNLSDQNFYIQSVELNNQPYEKSYISHQDIMNGGILTFYMGPNPNPDWGNALPQSKILVNDQLCAVPYLSTSSQTFTDSLIISIKTTCKDCQVYYSINDQDFKVYDSDIVIKEDAHLKAYTNCATNKSFTVNGHYKKINGHRTVRIESAYSNQYAAGGQNALVDYLRGSANFRTGYWQGYQGQDVIAIVDLGKIESINNISVEALQDIKSWIWYPRFVNIWTSKDGINFNTYGEIKNDFPQDTYGAYTKEFEITHSVNARYVKLKLGYPGNCPEWHLGAGGQSWIFVDEITIE